MTERARRSPLAVVLLALLAEEPMHPYRMQQLIKERGKDRIANVAARNSVYQAIERLVRLGLIEAGETERDERRPERTSYALTAEGRRTLHEWLRDMLASPAREFPEFPAALANMAVLEADEVLACLRDRRAALLAAIDEAEADVASAPGLPRLFLLETEYQITVIRAELRWVESLVDDLAAGTIAWRWDQLTEEFG